MIYELRVYTCLPGRLPALLARFEHATLAIWEKHGIRQAGFWTNEVGPGSTTLTYMLAWESLADRETKWSAFLRDPDWIAVKEESEKSGQLISNIANSLLKPTSFSAQK